MEGSREQAFDAFCAAQHDQLVRAVHLVCGDLGIAEELAQTALERAWARWDQVAGMASPGGWVQTAGLLPQAAPGGEVRSTWPGRACADGLPSVAPTPGTDVPSQTRWGT